MMVTIGSYIQMQRRRLERWFRSPGRQAVLKGLGCFVCGGVVSAASLLQNPMPLALGLLCGAPPGWSALLITLGAAAGYVLFWGSAAVQCITWLVLGFLAVELLGGRKILLSAPMLLPALAGLIVSSTGVAYLFWKDEAAPIAVYLLRVLLAMGSAFLFCRMPDRRGIVPDALTGSILVLSLAQLVPLPWLDLGYVAAAAFTVSGAFPMAALSGLALDLAQLTVVPMTAVLCVAFLVRLIPHSPRWLWYAAPAAVYLPISLLTGRVDLLPLPALALGSLVGLAIPHPTPAGRRGETAVAQVRLELASGVLMQMEEALLEMPEPETDSKALLLDAVESACNSCPGRKACTTREALLEQECLLQRPFLQREDLPEGCRKTGRLLDALRRSQGQLRSIRGEHLRRKEAKFAMVIQYRALATYLQELSDDLTRREKEVVLRFRPSITAQTRGRESANGDRCAWFSGTRGRYYVLLCDGMGTGLGAAQASTQGIRLLRRALEAGLPPEYAMGCLNSLCVLTEQGGMTTVDLAEIRLDTGRVTLYKWGAAPSFLLDQAGVRRIGFGSPPPGLTIDGIGQSIERLSLRQGEVLVLVSDGISPEALLALETPEPGTTAAQLASRILSLPNDSQTDDATTVIIQLAAGGR